MKLKSVELIGFKSFAKRTKLSFPSGITEIVGPNGSGKSNIIEAIRWALGEQSAKNLRSSRMTDVIFSGSQSHAALNRAKVTLTFDNSDHFINVNYTEIRVSRTVFRDGTNNYYLNGKPCRLRDIQDLFMNTGIGNGSFSIISQGKVAQIFKSKPEGRRFIIETVAGIYKYRSQKEIAAKKLAHVDDNLTRVHDLTYELKRRLNSLGQERDTAQQYLTYKRSADHLDIDRLSIRLTQLQNKLSRLQVEGRDDNSSVAELKKRIVQLRKKNERNHQNLTQDSKAYDQAQEQILSYSQRLDDLTNRNSLSRQKLSFWRRQITRYRSLLIKNRQRLKVLKANQKALKAKGSTVKSKAVKITKVLNRLNKKHPSNPVNKFRVSVDQLRSEYVELIKRSAKIKGQIDNLHQNRQQRQLQMTRVKSQIANVQNWISKVMSNLKGTKRNVSNLNQSITVTKKHQGELNKRYQQLSHQFQTVRKSYHISERKRQIFQIRLNGLKRINARHSNWYNGTRNLLNHQGRFTGILGPVAKFINVPTKYIRAVEITLRSQLQQVIVDDTQTAKRIVRFMSEHHLGRVTLLPLNAISKRWINLAIVRSCRQVPGFINVASNLVKMPDRFNDVKLHLLGNVLITKDISAAIQVSRIIHRRYRVVTLDGNVINSGGAITGGHGRYRYHGLLSQKAKIDQYQKAVIQLNRINKRNKNQGIHLVQQLDSVKNDLQSTQKRLNRLNQQLAVKTNLKTRLLTELHNYQNILSQRRKSFSSNGDGLTTASQLEETLNRIQTQVTKVHQELISKRDAMTRHTATFQRCSQHIQQAREELIKVEDKRNRFNHETRANAMQLNRIIHEDTDLRHEANHFTQAMAKQSHQVQSNAVLKRLSKRIDQITAKKVRYHKVINRNHQILDQLRSQLSADQNRLITLQSQINRERLMNREVVRKLHEVTEVLFRKYQIDVTRVKPPRPDASLYQISSRLYKIQKKLRQIGPVNVNAINQFKKVNHHYQFLSKQIKDLVTSQKQLATTMNQMDSKIKVRFKTTFDRINRAFKVTYAQIFRGGQAKLTLVDPKHLLTTGVNIMAQPPGKRYRSMELLSGGERALTAIALLFAILKIKPAPFCILDEAESALDAVNIDRFGNYMQKLKAKTQFIVITHRKTTMLYADNLYGVTMQDSGISKIISVNLKKAKTEG